MNNFCYFYLTCADNNEAHKIAKVLLEKRLVACAKFLPVDCKFRWQGEITDGQEILTIMESRADLFDLAEAEIAKIHSYETFVLEMLPVEKVSAAAVSWMNDNLKEEE